jgi:hypothetical protein
METTPDTNLLGEPLIKPVIPYQALPSLKPIRTIDVFSYMLNNPPVDSVGISPAAHFGGA